MNKDFKLIAQIAIVAISIYAIFYAILYFLFYYASENSMYDWDYHVISYLVPLTASLLSAMVVGKYKKFSISWKATVLTVLLTTIVATIIFALSLAIFQNIFGYILFCALTYYINLIIYGKLSLYFASREE